MERIHSLRDRMGQLPGLLSVLILLMLPLEAAHAGWPSQFGGRGPQYVFDVEMDSKGNSIVLGTFSDQIRFSDSEAYTADSSSNLFIAKYSSQGEFIWAQTVITAAGITPGSLEIDAADEVYISAGLNSQGSATIAGVTIPAGDSVIAKINAAGSWSWARSYGWTSVELSVPKDGNGLYVASTDADFTMVLYLLRMSKSSGEEVWRTDLDMTFSSSPVFLGANKIIAEPRTDSSSDLFLHVDGTGGIDSVCGQTAATGYNLVIKVQEVVTENNGATSYSWNCQWVWGGPDVPTVRGDIASDGTDVYFARKRITKISGATGTTVWDRGFDSADFSSIYYSYYGDDGVALESDDVGNIYYSGIYTDAPLLEGYGQLPFADQPSVFIAKLAPDETWQWVNTIARPANHYDVSERSLKPVLAVSDNATTVAVGSAITGSAVYDTTELVSEEFPTSPPASPIEQPADIFLGLLDANGGNWLIPQEQVIGGGVTPPTGALIEAPSIYINGELATDAADYTFWSQANSTLYIIGEPPGLLTLQWRTSTDLDPNNPDKNTTRIVVEPVLPPEELIQTHVADTAATLEPLHQINNASQSMRFARVAYPPGNDGLVSDGVFNRAEPVGTQSDYVVLHYTLTNTPDEAVAIDSQVPVFQVVYTKAWNDSAILQQSSACTVGTELFSAEHDDPNRDGHIVFETARYDASLHSAATGIGPIIPVNKSSQADNAMAVVWFGENGLGQYWGDSPYKYDCQWPQLGANPGDAQSIVIADQQGSGPLPANYSNTAIYNQPNPELPGFNANEEHALLLDNRVYAVRNDLNSVIADNNALYASEPYVLVKYLDLATEKWAFQVYNVESRRADSPFSPTLSNPVYTDQGLYSLTAGNLLQMPAPIRAFGVCDENVITDQSDAGWEDHTGSFWARSEGQVTAQYFYPLQPGFYYDLNNDGEADREPAECVPWLDQLANQPESTPAGTPINVTYEFKWPDAVPVLSPGETLFSSKEAPCSVASSEKCYLPQINGQAAAQIIYDETIETGNVGPSDALVKLIDPLSARTVDLESVNGQISTTSRGGVEYFSDLPFVIRTRLSYDPINKALSFGGWFDDSQIGDPHLLPNIMTARERDRILALQGVDQPFIDAINELYHLTRNPSGLDIDADDSPDQDYLVGIQPEYLGEGIDEDGDGVADNFEDLDGNQRDDRLDDPEYVLSPAYTLVPEVNRTVAEPQALLGTPMMLSAGRPTGTGYVTVAFNNDPSLGSLPVSLQVLRMDDSHGVYQGNVWVVPSDNIFEEALTLRHTGDFAGDPDLINFEWYFQPDTAGQPDSPPVPGNPVSPWIIHQDSGLGALDITIEGPGLLTLSDNWFITRYSNLGGSEYGNDVMPSPWAGDPSYDPSAPTSDPAVQAKAMLATGWIKRVIAGLNPFDQRVSDFHSSEVNTLTSMIAQAGEPYAGPIPFNPDPSVINSIGIIEAYQTVLERGKDLSINAGFNDIAANTQLLNVATRIADLYMLLGNEAYADAQDPTIGFGTDGNLGSAASSLFAFQNQLASPLEEELVLLRGRDDSRAGVSGYPVNNRLFWNFTQGNGEVAYVQNYRITDQDKDGFIDETDARALYPQGHGDAWGHYLSSVKSRYLLLREPNFTWKPRTESVLVAGVPIEVDYLDERKFASAAAAKAKAGSEIINLTYREKYVESPAGQWQGYKDTADQSDRAWGLDGWGRRAGQGAYFDWLTANAILPAEDNANQGIAKVDRTTVVELSQIADQFGAVQAQVDQADAGLNPLGLAKGVVPFDIDPNFLEVGSGNQGENHFDQIAGRAQVALDNALEVFNYANQQTQSLRSVQDSADDLNKSVLQQERDFKNRLIEIFGYPYAGDIGGGKTYPSGYDGPDLYHYMYVSTELTGDLPPPDGSFTGFYSGITFGGTEGFVFPGDVVEGAYGNVGDTLQVNYPVAHGADWEFIAPEVWNSRRAPGKVQQAISEFLQAQAQLQRAVKEHENLLSEITDAADLVKAEYQLNLDEIRILKDRSGDISDLNKGIAAARTANLAASTTVESISDAFDAADDGIPKVVGLSTDAFSAARLATGLSGIAATTPFRVAAAAAEGAELGLEVSKEAVELQTDIKLSQDTTNVALAERIKELEQLWREEALLRLELFTQAEVVNQGLGQYYEVLAEGQRLLEERRSFRVFTAGDVQENRYQDLTFRIFRNDALQKYRAQFDLAARYVYLAATAYDYETNLLGDDAGSGRKFLADIVRQRGLGQIVDGVPIAGTPGLADVLARLTQNFEIYRGQLGFNNPQVEANRFSLRYELFRKRLDPTDPSSELVRLDTEEEWRQKLEESRVDNLWDIPEFKRYARPFAPESAGPQPGLVIRFPTTINFGLNFFGHPLGGGDSAYDPTNFATKVRAVGTWFEGYDETGLSNTPRVYLLPVGMDVMRSPTGDTLATREWRVVDQKLPAPFPIGASDLTNPDWIPINDSLSGTYADIRRFSSYRAYHDSGEYVATESAADTRLVGRSVWNTDWMLIIPGGTLNYLPEEGLDRLIHGQETADGTRDGNGITDIKLHFQTYGFSGN